MQDAGSITGMVIQDPGSWILDAGSWIQDPGSGILDPGSTHPMGPCAPWPHRERWLQQPHGEIPNPITKAQIPTPAQDFTCEFPRGVRRLCMFPKQCLHCRGSHGVGKGPVPGLPERSRCRGAFSIVIYSTWLYLPSKTNRKINISGELLYFS